MGAARKSHTESNREITMKGAEPCQLVMVARMGVFHNINCCVPGTQPVTIDDRGKACRTSACRWVIGQSIARLHVGE